MSTAAEDQRRRANSWRSTVALVLRSAGFSDAEARPAARRSSAEVFTVEPDVCGVPGIHVVASPVGWARVSSYLTGAVHAADERAAGDLPVLVIPRQQHEPGDAYAILRAADFARLALDAQRGREG